MSFSYNPFMRIQVIVDVNKDYALYCPSCGKEVPLRNNISVRLAFQVMDKHVIADHKINPIDTLEWSVT